MAEILGLGCTHWPTLCLPNDGLTGVFKRVLDAPNVDPAVKDPANWPSELLAELGNDDGLSAANPATAGFRRHQRHSRSARPTGRARIGSPARNRPKSSANSWAVA